MAGFARHSMLSHIYRTADRCSPYNTIPYAMFAAYARLRYTTPWRAGNRVRGGVGIFEKV
ncbi:MAG: hypothetical protein E7039_02325 [Lentisphaerae bacterium]|nr:hypothetical protein [Lentisphaerota bacterium]